LPNVEKKGNAKPQNAASNSRKTTNGRKNSAKKKRVKRYIWGFCYLGLAVLSALTLIKGEGVLFGACYRIAGSLMGAGAYVLPAALLGAAVLLFIKRRGKVVLRTASLISIPFMFGAMLHVFRDQNAY